MASKADYEALGETLAEGILEDLKSTGKDLLEGISPQEKDDLQAAATDLAKLAAEAALGGSHKVALREVEATLINYKYTASSRTARALREATSRTIEQAAVALGTFGRAVLLGDKG